MKGARALRVWCASCWSQWSERLAAGVWLGRSGVCGWSMRCEWVGGVVVASAGAGAKAADLNGSPAPLARCAGPLPRWSRLALFLRPISFLTSEETAVTVGKQRNYTHEDVKCLQLQ